MFYVEHRKTRLLLLIPLLNLAILCVSCKKALEHPELSDPIYNELTQASAAIKKGIEEEKKALVGWKEDLKKPDLTVGEKRQILKQIAGSDKKLRLMEQDQKFFELRAKSRLIHVYEVYPARFEKGLPWPDPDELAEFEANKRLRGASRNWADHIPKLKYGPEKTAVKPESASAISHE